MPCSCRLAANSSQVSVQGYSVICYLNVLLSARLKRWCALCILEVGRRRGDRHGVIVFPDVDVGELRLVDIAAHQGRRHTQLLAGLILGEQAGIPAVDTQGLVKLLVSGDDVIEAPHQVISEIRDNLVVDGLFPAAQVRHEDVLSVDELSRLRRGPVAALRDTHNLTGDAEVLKDGIP